MSAVASAVKVVLMAVIGNFVITIAKSVAWILTGSPSLLAEAIHSFADTFNQVLLYIGLRHSQKEANKEFPLGSGSAQFVWNLISAVGVFFIGFGVTTYHGVHSLLTAGDHAEGSGEMNWIALGVLIFSFVVEGKVLLVAMKEVKRRKGKQSYREFIMSGEDPTTAAILLEDGVAVLGVTFAMAGFFLSHTLNSQAPDAVFSILIGILLGVMALVLTYTNGKLLIGTSVKPVMEDEIRAFIERQSIVEKVVKMQTRVLGVGSVRLALEVELHGTAMIDRDEISKSAQEIKGGADPAPILVSHSERMVRVVGREINDLEQEIHRTFPIISVIDFEVN